MNIEIKHIVFDLGRVLLNFSFDELMVTLKASGCKLGTMQEVAIHCDMNAYERGEITSTEFLSRIQNLVEKPIPHETLIRQAVEIFDPCHQMIELASTLKEKYHVVILSNVSELHWEHVKKFYKIGDLAHGLVASFEVGAMKPDPKIYSHVETEHNVTPHHAVFIDDLLENVQGAKNVGWHGIHHTGFDSTTKELKHFGVKW